MASVERQRPPKLCKYCEQPVTDHAYICTRCRKMLMAIARTPLKVLNKLVMDAREIRRRNPTHGN